MYNYITIPDVATLCCSKDDYKPALKGVYVNGKVYAMTDSYRLITGYMPESVDEPANYPEMIIPAYIWEEARKQKHFRIDYKQEFTPVGEKGVKSRYIFSVSDTKDSTKCVTGYAVEETYPPFKTVLDGITAREDTITIGLNPKYLYEIAKSIGAENLFLEYNKTDKRILLTAPDNYSHFAMLMGTRGDRPGNDIIQHFIDTIPGKVTAETKEAVYQPPVPIEEKQIETPAEGE